MADIIRFRLFEGIILHDVILGSREVHLGSPSGNNDEEVFMGRSYLGC